MAKKYPFLERGWETSAREDRGYRRSPPGRARDSERVTLDQAVSRVRRDHDGRVLSADTDFLDGRKIYRVRILTKEGRVKRFRIDAESGRRLPRPKRR